MINSVFESSAACNEFLNCSAYFPDQTNTEVIDADMSNSQSDAPSDILELPQKLSQAACEGLAMAICERRGADLTLNAESVSMISGLGAEILLRAATEWSQSGYALKLSEPSEEFKQGMDLLGIHTDEFFSGSGE